MEYEFEDYIHYYSSAWKCSEELSKNIERIRCQKLWTSLVCTSVLSYFYMSQEDIGNQCRKLRPNKEILRQMY